MHSSTSLYDTGLVFILEELGHLTFQPYHSPFAILSQFLVTWGGIELLGAHGSVSKDLLSFRGECSSRLVYDFSCRKFDIKCIKENVESISGFPVTSQ